ELRGWRRGALRRRPSRALCVCPGKGDAICARAEDALTRGATAAPSGFPPDLSGGFPGMSDVMDSVDAAVRDRLIYHRDGGRCGLCGGKVPRTRNTRTRCPRPSITSFQWPWAELMHSRMCRLLIPDVMPASRHVPADLTSGYSDDAPISA